MPANMVEPGQEAAWDRAKRAASKQYPDLTEEQDRYWKIVNHIFQNMKALSPNSDAMDLIDQDGDAALHRTGTRHMDKALVGLVSRPSLPRVLIAKSYIRAHTRTLRDGRTITVGAYFTKKVAKPDEEGKKGRAPRALKEAPSRGVHPGQTHEQLAHRLMRHVQEGTLSHAEAEANLAHLERRAHAGHHLEHGTGAAWTPEDTQQFMAHARGRLAEHKAGQEREAQRQRIEDLTGKQGEQAKPPPEQQRETPPGKDRPPHGITQQERQAQWDAKMRERQQAEREQGKPGGGEPRSREWAEQMRQQAQAREQAGHIPEHARTVTTDTALENTSGTQKQWPRNVRMGQLEMRARQLLGDRFDQVRHLKQAWGDRIEVWSKRPTFDGGWQRRREASY